MPIAMIRKAGHGLDRSTVVSIGNIFKAIS